MTKIIYENGVQLEFSDEEMEQRNFHEAPVILDMALQSAPGWACRAVVEEAGLLETVRTQLESKGPAWKNRFNEAATWSRKDALAMGQEIGMNEENIHQLFNRACQIAAGEV